MERFKELEIPVNVDFTPKDVKFPKYTLQNTLGKAEAEEMVARFLEFWQENDEWKAVSAKDVCEKIEEQAKDIHKTNNEVFTLMILDAARIDDGPNFVEIGMKYLFGKQYINTQRYGEGNNIAIYVAPTEKLLNAIRPFVQKWTYQHLNSGCIKPLFFKINNTNNYWLFTIKIYIVSVRNINKHCQTKKESEVYNEKNF